MAVHIEGGCLCGGVRYRLSELPKQGCDCHCLDCRRASAAAFVTWGAFRRENIKLLSGEIGQISHVGRRRSFARCCGTPLFIEDSPETEWVDVTICSLDEPKAFSPEAAIFTEDRLPWVPLDPARPAYRHDRGSERADPN